MRVASYRRETSETRVEAYVNLDGTGEAEIDTGIAFLDHLLKAFSIHSLVDVKVKAESLEKYDGHHLAEDVAIALGRAVDKALAERAGIRRFGFSYAPMDDSLAFAAVDLGGRPYLKFKASFTSDRIHDMDSSLVRHILEALAYNGRMNIHVMILYGLDDHHKAEALFKALALAFRSAVEYDPRVKDRIPSQKRVI